MDLHGRHQVGPGVVGRGAATYRDANTAAGTPLDPDSVDGIPDEAQPTLASDANGACSRVTPELRPMLIPADPVVVFVGNSFPYSLLVASVDAAATREAVMGA